MRYRRWYLVGLLALLATNAVSVAIPHYLQKALEAADPATGDGDFERWVALIFGFAIGLVFVRTASRLLIFYPGREAEYLLKNDYFAHLMTMQPTFFRRMDTGDLMSRGSNDIQFIRTLVGFAGLQVLNISFALPLNIVMMTGISGSLTLGCVVPLFLSGIVMRYAVSKMMRLFRSTQVQLADLSDEILESYNGIRLVDAYGAHNAMFSRFDERNDRYVDTILKVALIRAWLMPLVLVVGNLAILVLLFWGGTMVVEGTLHFGQISAFAVYVGNLVAALFSLGWVINVIQRGHISLERVWQILNEESEQSEYSATLPEGPLGIDVDQLTFSYPGSEREPALVDVSFSLPPGATLGVFGTTGSGKTTLIRLLTGLDTPETGAMRVGGVDVTLVDPDELRAAQSVVKQSPYLFGRSLRANIAMADVRDEITDTEIQRLLNAACLDSDLEALVDGMDTVVGERGVTLSGGQKQRVALARAFHKHSRMLILDDALSAVDHDTEQRLIESIVNVASAQTTVLISHRVSVLQHSDLIVVLDKGRLIQSGSHRELIAQPGIYKEAWSAHQKSLDTTEELHV